MINFFSGTNLRGEIPLGASADWPIAGHINMYNDYFTIWNTKFNRLFDQLNDYIADENNNESCDKETYYISFESQFKGSLKTIIKDCTSNALGIENPDPNRISSAPSVHTNAGVFGDMLKVLDNGSDNFLENYNQVKQLNKYECAFLDLFRFLITLQGKIKSGSIMGYFDRIFTNFKTELEAFYYYIINDTSTNPPSVRNKCEKINAIYTAWNNSFIYDDETYPAFGITYQNYKNNLTTGLEDLDKLVKTFTGFYDEVQVGNKVISAVNMVFYSDPQDADMIKAEGISNITYLKGDNGDGTWTGNTPEQRLAVRIRNGLSYIIPIALDSIPYINSTRSNSNTILNQVIKQAFDLIGIKDNLDEMKLVLDTQS